MMSRDTKCNSAEQVPFLEEWKARRERMRLRSSSSSLVGSKSIEIQVHQEVDLQTQTWASHAGQEHEKDVEILKVTAVSNKIQSLGSADVEAHDPVTSKTKEKKGSTQKKHRTQIEKRKLREKRRPTGVVNMIPSEDPDENEDVTANNDSNEQEAVSQEVWLSEGTNRLSDIHFHAPASDNRDDSLKARQSWMEELQKAVRGKRQENNKVSTQLNDKEESLLLLQKEMKTLTQKMKRAEDENQRLKEENQLLLKTMGQLSS
ncbi:PRKC apoptosis WT1 regulator protein-like [Mixophyes fleayi]|uniref:PRKC apoptosis WT1 regulator protein-like n=1 Tax=Mixophyes fleayi TaxID=3061075 RepID=UPI003F4DA646